MARSIHFHQHRHCPTSDNSIWCKPEVETVPKIRSTNNLSTETIFLRKILLLPVWIYLYFQCALRSGWYCFSSQSYNYFRYTSAILEFLGEGSVGWGCHIHQWKTCIPKIFIAIKIASLSVFVAKLLVLPDWVLSLLPVCTWWCSP